MNSGSYRIWVSDLSDSLIENGVSSRILKPSPETEMSSILEDIVIFSKNSWKLASIFKKSYPNKLVGAINIPADSNEKEIDFVIVGSHEERLSLAHYENVFIYPLIERKFMGIQRKIHKNNDTLKVCFHGHHPHLYKFFPHLKRALERVDREVKKTELHVVTGDQSFVSKWDSDTGRPNIDIFSHPYSSISEVISKSDIGIVPNISDVNSVLPLFRKEFLNNDIGLYNTDYVIRFKNKTNPGRAFVFYQHGVPVVHDISPSSFEMMALTDRYIVAHEEESWFKEIKDLAEKPEKRQELSDIYRKTFDSFYDPNKWAKKLCMQISEITK